MLLFPIAQATDKERREEKNDLPDLHAVWMETRREKLYGHMVRCNASHRLCDNLADIQSVTRLSGRLKTLSAPHFVPLADCMSVKMFAHRCPTPPADCMSVMQKKPFRREPAKRRSAAAGGAQTSALRILGRAAGFLQAVFLAFLHPRIAGDRKSTRLNSSHVKISYAVFCLKKKKKTTDKEQSNNDR